MSDETPCRVFVLPVNSEKTACFSYSEGADHYHIAQTYCQNGESPYNAAVRLMHGGGVTSKKLVSLKHLLFQGNGVLDYFFVAPEITPRSDALRTLMDISFPYRVSLVALLDEVTVGVFDARTRELVGATERYLSDPEAYVQHIIPIQEDAPDAQLSRKS